MSSPRGGVGLAPLSGKLIAVGGHNGKEYLKSVEIYDIESDSWEQGPPEPVCLLQLETLIPSKKLTILRNF